jgi:hypothetical protein
MATKIDFVIIADLIDVIIELISKGVEIGKIVA